MAAAPVAPRILSIAVPQMAGWAAACLAAAAIGLADGLEPSARFALLVFVAAIAAWTLTTANDCAVGLAACLALVAGGAVGEDRLYAALGGELMWLLIGAFAIAAVLRRNGAAELVALRVLRRARTVRRLFYAAALLTFATAFVIPSTSARAAILLPVYLALAPALTPAAGRALALLLPTAILLSAFAAITGAGAHLVAIDAIGAAGGPAIGYLDWAALAAPVALVSTLAATEIVLRLFLFADERALPLAPSAEPGRLDRRQAASLAIVAATVCVWSSEPLHGFGPAIVATAAALLLTCKPASGVDFKTAAKAVEWELLLFLAATLVLGHALADTGAAAWAARALAGFAGASAGQPAWLAAAALGVALAAHLAITSRTARAAVLIPSAALPLASLGADPTALVLLTVAGTGFCQTFAVSAKPVALFAKAEGAGIEPSALIALSAALLPAVAAILMGAALVWWPLLGLDLAP